MKEIKVVIPDKLYDIFQDMINARTPIRPIEEVLVGAVFAACPIKEMMERIIPHMRDKEMIEYMKKMDF